MQKELILAITTHRKFGVIFSSYIITPSSGNSFYTSIERANSVNVKDVDNYSQQFSEIQNYIHQYDDSSIANFFTKKKEDAVTFIKNVRSELVESKIRPYIERKLHNIIKLLLESNLRIYYKDRKYTGIYPADQITIAGPNAKAVFNFNRTPDILEYFLDISYQNKSISLKNKKALILTNEPCTVIIEQNLYRFQNIDSKKLKPFFDKKFISIPKQTEKVYFEKFILNAITNFKVKATGFEIIEEKPIPKPILYVQNDMKGSPVLLLKFSYGSQIILPNNSSSKFTTLHTKDNGYFFTKTIRDFQLENIIYEKLKKIGLSTKDFTHFYPKGINDIDDYNKLFFLINWLNQNIDNLTKFDAEVKQLFFKKTYLLSKLNLEISLVKKTNDWFDIKGTVQLGNFTIPFLKLKKHILSENREYKLPDGSIAILPTEWFAKYKRLFIFGQDSDNGIKLNNFHFGLIDVKEEGIDTSGFNEIKELFEGKFKEDTLVPEELNAELRPYQLSGFNWMSQLSKNGFGGCLADDMGLGKTIQALTLLLDASHNEVDEPIAPKKDNSAQIDLFNQPNNVTYSGKMAPTSMIIMPTSLIHNWQNEITKFTPKLKSIIHTGSNRTKDIWNFKNFDVVLTTYGVIRNDYELLKEFPFHYIILDESQAIKNSTSKAYKAVIKLNALNRIAITGTPVENSLTDLWSQMNFINPGLLGNLTYFKNEFVTPIEKHNIEENSEKLKSLIHPFILRRTKDEVAKDLPPKTEQIRYCSMSEPQKKIYEKEKSIVRNSILESMEEKGGEKTGFMVLQALTKLRQLANHPTLIGFDEESGKFEEVTRVLGNIIAEKHKVLIFSSFTKHLALYENYLNENSLKYSLLTGKTTNRQKVIDEFQTDSDNHVFLISLKAGGVGLNLTAADYVFILDPWWNPAAENQAINRAHRIGQDKKVFVYRFITSNTIEEKIVNMQNRKSDLANQFVNSNNPFKSLSAESIKELFE